MEIQEKNCLECGYAIKGRIDKKFCSDGCRSSFHNKLNFNSHRSIRYIDNHLKKNRRILMDCLNEENSAQMQIELRKVLKKGFVLDFHTHIEKMPNGTEYQFCYEFGFARLNEHEMHLIKQHPY
jgi:predicted nucleic acid-binding Zn ribbon protein